MESRWGRKDNSVITKDNSVITDDNRSYQSITDHNTIPNHTIPNHNNITSLSKDSLVGGQQADTPAKNEEDTDLFGQKIELKPESEKIPYEEIGQYWNEKAKGKLPLIKSIEDDRKTLVKQRWAEYHNDVYVAIDKITASDDMVRWRKCGFDWTFQKKNMRKILEGNYDNKKEEAVRRHKDYSDISDEALEKEFHWS